MIFEILPTQFKIEKLTHFLEEHVLPLDPIMQSKSFGGWSVLSSNNSYADGWHMGHVAIGKNTSSQDVSQALRAMGAKSHTEYVHPTEICMGYMMEVIEQIRSLGLAPRRARIIRLTAGMSSSWHRDAPDHIDFVRLHIPIITNHGCFFETESGRDHMPANGQSYLVRVNRLHRVINEGQSHRYHIVMDVVDHNKISQFHQPLAKV